MPSEKHLELFWLALQLSTNSWFVSSIRGLTSQGRNVEYVWRKKMNSLDYCDNSLQSQVHCISKSSHKLLCAKSLFLNLFIYIEFQFAWLLNGASKLTRKHWCTVAWIATLNQTMKYDSRCSSRRRIFVVHCSANGCESKSYKTIRSFLKFPLDERWGAFLQTWSWREWVSFSIGFLEVIGNSNKY